VKENTVISVSIVGDKKMRSLNKKYLSRDCPTDVLSFNMDEARDDGTFYLGDVIVNKDQAARQAQKYDNSFEEEVAELVAHGVLHLLGVNHPA